MIKMVLDIATMRVIYFTTDISEHLTQVDKTLIYEYDLDIPEGMTLKNCWNYRLVGNRLVNTVTNSVAPKISLIESNRQEALKMLVQRINITRIPLLSTCTGGDTVRELKILDEEFIKKLANVKGVSEDEYRLHVHDTKNTYIEKIKNTEINREYFQTQLKLAKTSERIVELRDKFVNSDLTQLQLNDSV